MMAFRRLSEEEHINTHAEGLRIQLTRSLINTSIVIMVAFEKEIL
jgi:hypothetical protein